MASDRPPNVAEELRRLRLLIDRLPAMIGYWDDQLRNVVANDSYYDYFGRRPDEMRGLHMRDLVGESVFAVVGPHAEKVLLGEPQLFESTLTDPRGELRHFETSYVPDIVDGKVRGFFVQSNDVTARVQAEQTRDEALRFFQLSMANAPVGKAVLTTAGQALMVNPALCQLLGCSAEKLSGSSYRDFVHPDELAALAQQHRRLVDGEVPQIAAEHRYVRADGTTIWVQRNAVLAPGQDYGVEDVVIAQFQDITARRRAEAELARLAVTDQLTGLYNRRALVGRIDDEHAVGPVGLVFIDLDGFKTVNDMHGHAAGDTVLVEVAGRLSRAVPEPNSVYRMGGDEFVVLVPEAREDAVVAELSAAVCEALTGQYAVDSDCFQLTASVGWTRGQDSAEALIREADMDMYRHKGRLRASAQP